MMLIFIAFLLSAVSFHYSGDIGWLAWLAPLPILLVSSRLSVRNLLIGSVFVYWAGSMSWWRAESFVVPVPLFLGYHLVYALVFGLIMVWVRKTSIVWLFPLGWTAFEFLFAYFSPEGTWGSLAYTQANYLALMQNASVFGVYGIVFLVCLFPAAAAYLLKGREWRRSEVVKASILVAALLTASTWGFVRIDATSLNETVRMGLTAANHTVHYEASKDSAKNMVFVKEYLNHVAELADQGAKIVVFPEKLVRVTSDDQQEMEALFAKSAMDNHVYVDIGVKLKQNDGVHNKAWVYSPDGKKIIDHDKMHLVRGFEDGFIKGNTIAWFDGFSSKIGTVICKDMDFPSTIRRYGQEQIGALLVPAWDWKGSEQIHARMAVVRGIENGFSVVRPSKEGLVTVSDRYGRVLAEKSTFDNKVATLLVDVPITPQQTLYNRFGDWFGWLVVGITILASVIATSAPEAVASAKAEAKGAANPASTSTT